MTENEITYIFCEIDMGMLTSNQFHYEIERPFTNLNDISTKLAGKTYINIAKKFPNCIFFSRATKNSYNLLDNHRNNTYQNH